MGARVLLADLLLRAIAWRAEAAAAAAVEDEHGPLGQREAGGLRNGFHGSVRQSQLTGIRPPFATALESPGRILRALDRRDRERVFEEAEGHVGSKSAAVPPRPT